MEAGQGPNWGCSAKIKKSCPYAELIKHANEVSICIGDCVYILLKGIDHVTNSNFQLPVGGASLAQASGNTHTRWDLRLCWSTIE
jgi:hypothetical protein